MQEIKDVARRILAIMEVRKMSYGEVAKEAKLNKRTVWDVTNGQTDNPGCITLARIAGALRIPVIAFFDEDCFKQAMQHVLVEQYGDVLGFQEANGARTDRQPAIA